MWPTCLLVTFMGTWGCWFLPVELYSCLLCLWSQEVNRKKVVAHLYWVYEWPDMVLHMEVESYGCFPMKSGIRTRASTHTVCTSDFPRRNFHTCLKHHTVTVRYWWAICLIHYPEAIHYQGAIKPVLADSSHLPHGTALCKTEHPCSVFVWITQRCDRRPCLMF